MNMNAIEKRLKLKDRNKNKEKETAKYLHPK